MSGEIYAPNLQESPEKKNVVPSEPKIKVQGGGTLEPSPETRYGTTQPSGLRH